MSEQENTSGVQVPLVSLLKHLSGLYIGLAICSVWLPRDAIVSGAVFATLNLVAFWLHIRHAKWNRPNPLK